MALQPLSLVGNAELAQVRFTLGSRDHQIQRMQDGCNDRMASNGSRFMVTWIVFNNHLVEVGLTQNRETMALRNLTTVDSLYFYHMWRPHMNHFYFIEIAFGWRPSHILLHTKLEDTWPHNMILEVFWDNLWTLLLGSQFHDRGSLASVWSGP